jgi:hypothetical protein
VLRERKKYARTDGLVLVKSNGNAILVQCESDGSDLTHDVVKKCDDGKINLVNNDMLKVKTERSTLKVSATTTDTNKIQFTYRDAETKRLQSETKQVETE